MNGGEDVSKAEMKWKSIMEIEIASDRSMWLLCVKCQ